MRTLMLTIVAALALSLTGCGGSDAKGDGGRSPEKVLAAAKAHLDATSGLTFNLTSEGMPDGVSGLINGSGVLTHAPAFDGIVTVQISGLSPKIPVISVDGEVFAQLPLTTGWQRIDPTEYGAPDPAALMKPSGGLSDWLTATTEVKVGKTVRGGAGNKEVLTTYSGVLAADLAQVLVPTVATDLKVSYTITDKDELRTIELTGDIYGTSDTETYTVTLDDYGTTKDIKAPQ